MDYEQFELQHDDPTRYERIYAHRVKQRVLNINTVKAYYTLTKPGIVYGNAIAAVGGFLFASAFTAGIDDFLKMIVGVCLVMASGCVINNFLDRGIDKKMNRTKQRSLVIGAISVRNAIVYGAVLGVAGVAILYMLNPLTAYIAMFGWFAYVVIYGIGKRKTVHGTLIGSISGATPPVIGYVAVANTLDVSALILFLTMAVWQMPHFYAIAMFRLRDYAAANIPVLPVKYGMRTTKHQIIAYIVGFILLAPMLTIFGGAGYLYGLLVAILGMYWLYVALNKLHSHDDVMWARSVFGASLTVLLGYSVLISVGRILP